MKNGLVRVIAGTLVLASLIPNFGCYDSKKQPKKDTTYQQALKIAQNPSSVLTGDSISNLPQKQLEVKASQILVKNEAVKEIGLENYFFQAEELDGLSAPLKVSYETEKGVSEMDYSAKKRIFSSQELEDVKEALSQKELCSGKNLTGYANDFYTSKKEEVWDEEVTKLYVYKFKTNPDAKNFLNEMVSSSKKNEQKIFFLKENVCVCLDLESFLKYTSEPMVPAFAEYLDIKNRELGYIKSLGHYAKRIGGEFVWIDNRRLDCSEVYDKLEIQKTESSNALSEALKFQEKFYTLSEDDCIAFLKNWLNLTSPINGYYKKEMGVEEARTTFRNYSKSVGKKIFFNFPYFGKTVSIWDPRNVLSYVMKIMDYDDQALKEAIDSANPNK